MNAEVNQNHGSGNWIAFLFGAVFNLMANVNLAFMLGYVSQAIVGGFICLLFKIIGDVLSPLWQKHKVKFNSMRVRGMRRRKSRSRNDHH
jgi:hypothetical protein